MNNLAQSLVNHNGHLTWRQRLRLLTVQIFGHEGLYSVNHLIKTSHCPILNEDIHRLYTVKWEHLAKRKLLNPFKWVEFAISVPIEMVAWATWFLHIPKLITEVALGVARRVLAPVRYVIRPTLEMAREKPLAFIALVIAALAIAAYLASVIFSGGGTLVVGGIVLASSMAAKGGFFAAATAGIYMGLLKLTSTIDNVIDLLRRPNPPHGEDQKVKQFTNGAVIKEVNVNLQVLSLSLAHTDIVHVHTDIEPVPVKVENTQYTDVITENLHAINPKHTDVKKPSEQNFKHQLALFTGTESFFFKRSTNPKPPCDFEYIDDNDKDHYQLKYIPTK